MREVTTKLPIYVCFDVTVVGPIGRRKRLLMHFHQVNTCTKITVNTLGLAAECGQNLHIVLLSLL